MTTIIVEVKGGVVQHVYTPHEDVRIVLVDWDREECGEHAATHYPATVGGQLSPDTHTAIQSLHQ